MDQSEQNAVAMAAAEQAPVESAPGWKRRARYPLMLLGVLVVAGLGVYFYLAGGRFESTDDAYVKTARVSISANVPGRVIELAVHDNQRVKAGDLLYKLDDAPFLIAVQEAEAQLATTRLQLNTLKANYRQRQAELSSAQDTVAFQKRELDRQQRLVGAGIASQAQVDRASHAYDEAKSRIAGVTQESGAVVAQLGGNISLDPDQHPAVKQAQATLDRARLNLSYTTIRAPADGVVTKVEDLQVGSYVNASVPVFALVSTHDLWLEANFKEDQLAHMRVGQDADVKVDSYPDKVFKGKVVSVSPGTGSQFSVLPAENATGNWVKVVQRLPVRVELESLDPNFPLQGGLSATVDVDTRYQRHLFSKNEVLAPAPAVAAAN
jgi:membrane fusion protein (multidrug efflux system)